MTPCRLHNHMANKPKLNDDDYERIEAFLETPAFEREPEDLIPDEQ